MSIKSICKLAIYLCRKHFSFARIFKDPNLKMQKKNLTIQVENCDNGFVFFKTEQKIQDNLKQKRLTEKWEFKDTVQKN